MLEVYTAKQDATELHNGSYIAPLVHFIKDSDVNTGEERMEISSQMYPLWSDYLKTSYPVFIITQTFLSFFK